MAPQSRLIFVNLPVQDVGASITFFSALGFGFDEKFTSEECACMVVSEQAYVMLLDESRFADFTTKPIADARASTEAILCVSADSREAVDAFADAALDAGASRANEPMDQGFMYGRSFQDLDGHLWEVMWMSPEAVEQGPADGAKNAERLWWSSGAARRPPALPHRAVGAAPRGTGRSLDVRIAPSGLAHVRTMSGSADPS